MRVCACVCACVCLCVYVCVGERERETERIAIGSRYAYGYESDRTDTVTNLMGSSAHFVFMGGLFVYDEVQHQAALFVVDLLPTYTCPQLLFGPVAAFDFRWVDTAIFYPTPAVREVGFPVTGMVKAARKSHWKVR